MIYKTLKKVSNVCQLLNKSKYPATQTVNGITFTNNGDGSYTANGTLSSYLSYLVVAQVSNLIVGHKYYSAKSSPISGVYVETKVLTNNANFIYLTDNIHEWVENETVMYITLVTDVGQNSRVENVILKPQLFDLTEMYGAGNEPKTVEQFRQDFPDEMYDYKPYCFVKSYKNCLKVSDVCQLMVYPYFETTLTRYGITFTDNGDGTITANGTSVGFATFVFSENFNFIAGNKYYVSTPYSVIAYKENGTIKYAQGNILFTWKSNWKIVQVYMQINKGKTVSNLTFKPQLFDLTEMYGSGNEPTTVEEFKADFPNELYDYKPYSIVPSYKKSLICTTKNLFDISKVFSAPTLCFDVSSLEIGKTYTFSSNKPIMVFKISDFRGGYNSVIYGSTNGFTTFTFVMARDEHIPVTAKQYLFLWLLELSTGDINTSGFVTDISQLDGYNLQIELGDTATEYHPYGYL